MSDRKRDRVVPLYTPPGPPKNAASDGRRVIVTEAPSMALVPTRLNQQPVTVQHVQRGATGPLLPLLSAKGSKRAASFRVARQRLLDRDKDRVLLVTSPNPGEGKSVAAANLALSFAELGRHRILLVEANLQRPSLARLFGITPARCFYSDLELHRTQPDQPWAVMAIAQCGIHLLAVSAPSCTRCGHGVAENARFCGFCGNKLAERVIDGAVFAAAIARMRMEFDWIFIDGPPVLDPSGVSVIQEASDALVMVLRAAKTRARSLAAALELVSGEQVAAALLMES